MDDWNKTKLAKVMKFYAIVVAVFSFTLVAFTVFNPKGTYEADYFQVYNLGIDISGMILIISFILMFRYMYIVAEKLWFGLFYVLNLVMVGWYIVLIPPILR